LRGRPHLCHTRNHPQLSVPSKTPR
jgi:hypothetical protein